MAKTPSKHALQEDTGAKESPSLWCIILIPTWTWHEELFADLFGDEVVITCFCRHEERSFGSELRDGDVVVQDGLGVVGHAGQQVAVEDHLAIVEVEAANLREGRS